ncbi:MAG TPA: choice-of-anchor Q domain-containing protein [Anaerolineales bacterium]
MQHRRILFTTFFVIGLLIFALFAPEWQGVRPAHASPDTTWTVTSNGDGFGFCTQVTCTTLRAAIAAAAPSGDTITFAPGLNTILLAAPLTINKDLTIQGPGSLNGSKLTTVFIISTGNSTISGLTIHNGVSSSSGLMCLASPDTSSSCGGGIVIESGAILTLNNSTLSGNSAPSGYGGGILNGSINSGSVSSTLTINNSIFSDNLADHGYGGGIFNGGINTLMIPNGITSSKLTISNSTFSGNSAPNGSGGGIFNAAIDEKEANGPALFISNSTFSGNSAPNGSGGGIFNSDATKLYGGILNLGSSILWGNTADLDGPNILGVVVSQGNNLIGTTKGVPGNWQSGARGDQLNVLLLPPLLGPLASNGGPTETMSLLQIGSNPAVGTGFCAWKSTFRAVTTDQRGFVRKTPCDVGAFESGANPPTPTPGPTPGPCLGTSGLLVLVVIWLHRRRSG